MSLCRIILWNITLCPYVHNFTVLYLTAFDTIDNTKLLEKLQYYGIQGSELVIFQSFLSERTQYVAIDTFRSETMDCPPCSVIQGSKLSAVLYIIYTNKIPVLQTLMSQDIYYNLTNTQTLKFNDIKHTTVNYVDQSVEFENQCIDFSKF